MIIPTEKVKSIYQDILKNKNALNKTSDGFISFAVREVNTFS